MTTTARLSVYGVVVALLAAGAYLLGSAVGPLGGTAVEPGPHSGAVTEQPTGPAEEHGPVVRHDGSHG